MKTEEKSFPKWPLGMRLLFIGVIILFVLYITNRQSISVNKLSDKKGDIVAQVGMPKDEVLSNLGAPYAQREDQDLSSICYELKNSPIRAPWQRTVFNNKVKIIFLDNIVRNIYFFMPHKGNLEIHPDYQCRIPL